MRIILSDLFIIVVVSIKICSSITTINYGKYCPEGYNRIAGKPLCILVTTKPSSYDNECLKSGSTPTAYYAELINGRSQAIENYLVEAKINQVWLPIKRDANNFLVWDLPGPMKQNGRVTEINMGYLPSTSTNGDCIVYDINWHRIYFKDCNHAYQLMCLINTRELYIVPYDVCGSKFIGRLSKFHETCFTINDILIGNTTKIDSNDTFVVVDQLIRKLNMQNETILVYDPLSSSPDSSAFKEGRIQIVDKHIVKKQVIQTQHVITKSPSIDIEFNATNYQLTVIVTNYELLWNPKNPEMPFWCNNEFDILTDSEIKSQYRGIYSFKTSRVFSTYLSGNERGIATIWCEGQMLKTFQKIKSNILIAERNIDVENFVLCAKLKWDCDEPCQLGTEYLINIANELSIKRNQFAKFEVEKVHVKQILMLNENSVNMLLHFVVRFNGTEYSNKIDNFETEITEFFGDSTMTELRLNNVCKNPNDFFPSAKLGEKVLAKTPCYNSEGFLPAQECVGNLIGGAHWKEILNTTVFDGCSTAYNNIETIQLFNVTKQLKDLEVADGKADDLDEIVVKITELIVNAIQLMNITLTKALNIKDTRLVSETLHIFAEIKQTNIFDGKIKEGEAPGAMINPITNMIDKILELESNSLLQGGNTMLDTIDRLATHFANSNASESKEMLDEEGVRIIQTNNLILVFINPLIKNITGIELHRKTPEVEDFTDFKIKTLHKNHRIEDTNTESDTLEVMALITSEAFDKIKIIKDNVLVPPNRLIFKFYYKPSLFEEEINDSLHVTPDSKVIGISIPNFPMREFPEGVVTMFKTITETTKETETRGCSQNSVKSSSTKGWDIKLWNKKLETKNIVTCEVRRPGNIGFAKLVGVRERDPEYAPMSQIVETSLNVITFIGCTLSIIGLTLIFVTAIFNPAWQQNEATPLILNISIASLFLIVMYFVTEIFSKPHYIEYCSIIGSLAHCAVLVGFFISVIVTNCQYHRYIVIFGNSTPKYLNLQIYLFGWLTPSLIVAICFFFASESYIKLDEDRQTEANGIITIVQTLTCFPTKITLYVGLHLPIIVIFCYNLTIYVWIIIRVRQETPNLRRIPPKSSVYIQIRLFLYLFFILSITWIFALLHHYIGFDIFALLFNVTGTMQGCCLAIFCIFVHQETRNFWLRKLMCSNKKQHYNCN